jgi:hypothetical protein
MYFHSFEVFLAAVTTSEGSHPSRPRRRWLELLRRDCSNGVRREHRNAPAGFARRCSRPAAAEEGEDGVGVPDGPVAERAEQHAGEGRDEVDPHGGVPAEHDGRAQGPDRVHRTPGDRPDDEAQGSDRGADGQPTNRLVLHRSSAKKKWIIQISVSSSSVLGGVHFVHDEHERKQ